MPRKLFLLLTKYLNKYMYIYYQKCCKAKNETQNIENEQDSKELRRTQLELPALELKKLPLAAVVGATSHSSSRKCTPPIMQTVIINGRKYIAISATASDN